MSNKLIQLNPEKVDSVKRRAGKAKRVATVALALYGGATIAHQTGLDRAVANQVREVTATDDSKSNPNTESETTASVGVLAEPGDSPWSIATKVYPDRDVRSVVDEMMKNPAVKDGIVPNELVQVPASEDAAREYQERLQGQISSKDK